MSEPYDYRNCWYPITFLRDVAPNSITQFSLYDEQFILLRDSGGNITCLRDRCPHRAATLSAGKLKGDLIECQYHGWQFDLSGKCVRIPQLEPGAEIPERACVESYTAVVVQGVLWVWPGEAERAEVEALPAIPDLDRPDIHTVDYAVDLPYDQGYLIENVIDVAHIHIAHNGVRGGGRRDLALPLEFTIKENSAGGIRAQFRSIGLPESSESPLKAAFVDFRAPILVHYTSEYKNPGLRSGLALYATPLGLGRSRLIYRKYANFHSWKERIKPRWLEHLTQNTILQQDMAIIVGQYGNIEKSNLEMNGLWLPLRTSDQLVLAYRRWLDEYGGSLPFYRGYRTSRMPSAAGRVAYPRDTYRIHTRNCRDCSRIREKALLLKKVLGWMSVSAILAAVYLNASTAGSTVLVVAVVLLFASLGASRFARLFE